jgi:hypothetical protein
VAGNAMPTDGHLAEARAFPARSSLSHRPSQTKRLRVGGVLSFLLLILLIRMRVIDLITPKTVLRSDKVNHFFIFYHKAILQQKLINLAKFILLSSHLLFLGYFRFVLDCIENHFSFSLPDL